MKFIVDAQLPISLSSFLIERGADSIHTLELPDANRTTDIRISKLANDQERVVITKDIDFLKSYLLKAEPAKLILVKTGNISNKSLIKIFDKNLKRILMLLSESNLIEIDREQIAAHGL